MCRQISSYELKLHTPNEVGAALVIDKNVSTHRSATRGTVEPKKSMKANLSPQFFGTNVTEPRGSKDWPKK